jgi:hypothetical protein
MKWIIVRTWARMHTSFSWITQTCIITCDLWLENATADCWSKIVRTLLLCAITNWNWPERGASVNLRNKSGTPPAAKNKKYGQSKKHGLVSKRLRRRNKGLVEVDQTVTLTWISAMRVFGQAFSFRELKRVAIRWYSQVWPTTVGLCVEFSCQSVHRQGAGVHSKT